MIIRAFRRSPRLVAALWLALLTVYILAGTAFVPFHGDESTQIYMSRDYAYLFLDGDLERVRYSAAPASPTEQHLRLLNGVVSKYLIGLAWRAAGFSLADLNEQWDWGADWNYNQQNGHAPAPALLLAARWPSALLLALGAAAMFALGCIVGGAPAAYLGSLYYALHPALLLNGRRAMMEGSFLAFSLLALLAGLWFVRRPGWKPALALGLAAGLALASKHTALFGAAAVFIGCLVMALPASRRLLLWLAAALLALLVFLALNPAWWDDPLGRAAEVLRLRQELLAIQTSVFGSYTGPADQLAGFLHQTFIAHPQYYEAPAWADYIGGQIADYEASPWCGVSLGGSIAGGALLAALTLWGGGRLLRRRDAVAGLILLWSAALALSTLALTPLEWGRYYLPVYPAIGLLAAVGVTDLTRRIHTRFRQPISG